MFITRQSSKATRSKQEISSGVYGMRCEMIHTMPTGIENTIHLRVDAADLNQYVKSQILDVINLGEKKNQGYLRISISI